MPGVAKHRPPSPALAAQRAGGVLSLHLRLLADGARNRAFERALRRHVTPGCSVLDLGAGSGVWAIAAARLGARRVVALEREPLLSALIERLAAENGVADRVEVVCADARRVRLRERFDVVVCELVGNRGFDEALVPILRRARERFLRPGGVLIPRAVSLRAAPGRLSPRPPTDAAGTSVKARRVFLLGRNLPLGLRPPLRFTPLAPAATLVRVDLRQALREPDLSRLRARWRLRDARPLDAVAVWAHCELTQGISLSTLNTHWEATLFPAAPFRGRGGWLELRLDFSGPTWRWDLRLGRGAKAELQSHSPLLALAGLGRPATRR